MATLLESYTYSKNRFDGNLVADTVAPEEVWRQQERLYRLAVLETCQMFVKTAPVSSDAKQLYWHYLMVDAYFQSLTQERRYSTSNTEKEQKQRDTAHGNLLNVIQDYRRKFSSFAPGKDSECYRKLISGVIQTVIPVWIQFRQSYFEVKKEAIQNEQQ